MRHPDSFGCERCWPADAELTWQAMRELQVKRRLVDESHFMIKLRVCAGCGQQFVSVFTETIDWQDGDDPQLSSLMPVTPDESAALQRAGGAPAAVLRELAPQRRSLCHDFPKGGPKRSFWTQGIVIGPYD